MTSDTKDVVDTWSGEAALDALMAVEEQAIIDAGLESIARHGTISHDEAMRRIDDLLARLRPG